MFRKKRKRALKEISSTSKKSTFSDKASKDVDKEHIKVEKKKKKKEERPNKSIAKDQKDEDKATPPKKDVIKEEDESTITKNENSAVVEAAKKEASNLKRKVDRLYKKCVEEIEKLTSEHLPRKVKGGGTSKCQGERGLLVLSCRDTYFLEKRITYAFHIVTTNNLSPIT